MTSPHSRYPHLFLVVRVDAELSPENAFSVVSAWRTEPEAVREVERLQRLVEAEVTTDYRVLVTRLKSAGPHDEV